MQRIYQNKKLLLAVFALLILSAGLIQAGFYLFREVKVKQVVESQLSALRQGKIAMAYHNVTSQEFKSATSLNDFTQFIQEHPLFINFSAMDIKEPAFDPPYASTKVHLEDEHGEFVEVLYELVQENYSWKILGVHIKPLVKNEESATAEMIAPIQHQLDSFQKGDILEAYQNSSSNDFLESTSFENFKTFVIRNPLLSQFDHYSYHKHSMQGTSGRVEVVLNPDAEALPVEYYLRQNEDGKEWKIQYMQVVVDAGEGPNSNSTNTDQLMATLKELMAILKEKNYDHFYHDFIASDVQKTTSEETFENFFKNNPVFFNYLSYNIKEPYIENLRALVTLNITNEEGITDVEISLRIENSAWKVTGIHIDKVVDRTPSKDDDKMQGFKTRDLMTVIHAFLNSLQKGNTVVAYQKFTSEYFQEANTVDQFKEFIAKHAELAQEIPSSFEKIMFNNNIATLAGKLYLSNSMYLPVEFDLIQDNDKWKILHIYTYPVIQDKNAIEGEQIIESSRSLSIDKIIVGTEVNSEGSILNPSNKLSIKKEDIYINLFIQNGTRGTPITVILRHVPSGSEIAPITAALTENGINRLSFIFSPPPKGWPKGPYLVRVSALNKEYKTFGFTIE